MTTRVNGLEIHKHHRPSEGPRRDKIGGTGKIHYTREYTYYEDLFKKLDSYLASEPGTDRAAKALKKARGS